MIIKLINSAVIGVAILGIFISTTARSVVADDTYYLSEGNNKFPQILDGNLDKLGKMQEEYANGLADLIQIEERALKEANIFKIKLKNKLKAEILTLKKIQNAQFVGLLNSIKRLKENFNKKMILSSGSASKGGYDIELSSTLQNDILKYLTEISNFFSDENFSGPLAAFMKSFKALEKEKLFPNDDIHDGLDEAVVEYRKMLRTNFVKYKLLMAEVHSAIEKINNALYNKEGSVSDKFRFFTKTDLSSVRGHFTQIQNLSQNILDRLGKQIQKVISAI